MRFRYRLVPHWPPLSWLAVVSKNVDEVEVLHGNQVEVHADFFCEAIWAGEFSRGEFDRTDLVFGSGGRLRANSIVFVSSGSTVDRLQSLQRGDTFLVSNSLPCLMSVADASVDPASGEYFQFFSSIIHGIRDYQRVLQTSAGSILLTYFDNLRWHNGELIVEEKPRTRLRFLDFADYRDFLVETIKCMSRNMAAKARRHVYSMIGTLSSGYDSATAATIGRSAGLSEAISFTRARSGDADSGEAVARVLGIRLHLFDRNAWRSTSFAEVPFIAGDAKGEDVYFRGAEEYLRGQAVLTGFHGGKIWDAGTHRRDGQIRRKDQSGLSLTEYRLWAGFIHCPVAFLGARQERDIYNISMSEDMAEWDIGGGYSKPISRRVIEEAGAPRTSFGMAKNAASVLFWHRWAAASAMSSGTYVALSAWFAAHSASFRERGLLRPDVRQTFLGPAYLSCSRLSRVLGRFRPLRKSAVRVANWADSRHVTRWMFPWAMEEAKKRYGALQPRERQLHDVVAAGMGAPTMPLEEEHRESV